MNDGGPAFPCSEVDLDYAGGRRDYLGMSLRDWFAGQALTAIISQRTFGIATGIDSELAYKYADAMLAERKKGER